MYKGMYSAVSGALASQKRLDTITNNLANVNTTGFKSDHLLFESYLAKNAPQEAPGVINDVEYTIAHSTYTDLSQATIRPTGSPLDIALKGEGFISVMTYQGERFTRNGNFTVGSSGELVTGEGHIVLSEENQPIFINNGTVTIDKEGGVWVSGSSVGGSPSNIGGLTSASGDFAGRIKLVAFEKPVEIVKEGGSLFRAEDPNSAIVPENLTVEAGHLEGSNVNMIREMTQLISNQRTFQTLQKSITENDNMTMQLLLKVARAV